MFANGPEDRGSIPGQVIPKTKKVLLDAALINTQHYKVRIKSSWGILGMTYHLPQQLSAVAIEKGASELPSTKVTNFTFIFEIGRMRYCTYIFEIGRMTIALTLLMCPSTFFRYFLSNSRNHMSNSETVTELGTERLFNSRKWTLLIPLTMTG